MSQGAKISFRIDINNRKLTKKAEATCLGFLDKYQIVFISLQ